MFVFFCWAAAQRAVVWMAGLVTMGNFAGWEITVAQFDEVALAVTKGAACSKAVGFPVNEGRDIVCPTVVYLHSVHEGMIMGGILNCRFVVAVDGSTREI